VEGKLKTDDPSRIGPYRLIQLLGEGGMGRVYLGRSVGGRLVAVKVIRREFTVDPGFRERFRREVAAAQRVNGLYTAHVVDADPEGPEPWLATAYIDAPSLAAWVRARGPLPAAEVKSLAAALAEGLRAIHGAGLVHRDLTPRNVLLASDGPRIIDFGLARLAESPSMTRAGALGGTPGYMSPELIQGGEVGPPSDVFSLGTVIHYAATGDGPWGVGATEAMLYRLVHEPPNLERLPVSGVLRQAPQHDRAHADRPTPGAILAELGDPDLLGDARTAQPMATWDGALFASLAPELPASMPDSVSEQNTMSVPGDPNQLPLPQPVLGAGPMPAAPMPAAPVPPMAMPPGPMPPGAMPPGAMPPGAMPVLPRPPGVPAGSVSAEDAVRITLVSLIIAAVLAAGVIAWFINEWFAITVYALTAVAVTVWWLRS
jgi:serine/threonine protein kinase